MEDRFFRLVDLAHRELTFENEVIDEVDDRVMLRSIPIKLSRQIYYNTYFSRRKCHLSCLYSLAVTHTRRLITTGVFLCWLHPVAATRTRNLIVTCAPLPSSFHVDLYVRLAVHCTYAVYLMVKPTFSALTIVDNCK